MHGTFQIAVDIGGTFTDGVLHQKATNKLFLAKALTTNHDPGEAVATVIRTLLAQINGLTKSSAVEAEVGGSEVDALVQRVVHGTTLVTNTLVERTGARAALLLSIGTEDCLDIRRELRYDIYDLDADYPTALIPRDDRFAVNARLGPDGSEWRPLVSHQLDTVVSAVVEGGYGAVAVCLLHAPVNGTHEQALAAALRAAHPQLPVSLSSMVAGEIGEYERMSTTAANAYVQPIVGRYLNTLEARLEALECPAVLDIMLSNGGFTNAKNAAAQPIRILESGPAGGVLSAINCAAQAGHNRVLAFDMGGTTAKAGVAIDGAPDITHVFEFARIQRFKPGSGLPAVAPSMDLIEIGAGGGSLAWVNPLGLLQVGPRSAGAEPGPACYGLGGSQATVTDADLLLGYLDSNSFLGGTMPLDATKARAALTEAGAPLGLDWQATAWGIHDIVNENMASAARTHIAEKGLDARTFTMVATGGAGPVHAVDVAKRLRIRRVLCPIASGVGSCLGFLAAPARADRTWSKVELLAALDAPELTARLEGAVAAIIAELAQSGLEHDDIIWHLAADIRYLGQGNALEVTLPWQPGTTPTTALLRHHFEGTYKARYQKPIDEGQPEVVTWRLTGHAHSSVLAFSLAESAVPTPPTPAPRPVYLPHANTYAQVAVYARAHLRPHTAIEGPLIIEEPQSTLVVAQPATVNVLASGTIEVLLEGVN